MGQKIQINLNFDQDLEQYLQNEYEDIADYRILSKSLDVRGIKRGKKPRFNYSVELVKKAEEFQNKSETFTNVGELKSRPIIVGMGPAGLFCALRLIEYGVPSIIIERGSPVAQRMKEISKFWRYGEFNPEDNVCFGEGGAGLFSDGKLHTRVNSPFLQYVMNRLVDFGAPKDTAYLANPHVGSNKLRRIISHLSEYLVQKGCEIKYHSCVTDILTESNEVTGVELGNKEKIYSNNVILATGHSARDVYHLLNELGVKMRAKDFAVGVRIEHPRTYIDSIQHGKFAGDSRLGTALYRLSHHNKKTERGTYSFCMCPGGYVLSAGTDKNGIVINGMSNYLRNSNWSNSAIVVSVKAEEDFSGVLGGINFQNEIEQKAFTQSKEFATGREIPAINLLDFLEGKKNKSKKLPKSSTPSDVFNCDLEQIFPSFISTHLKDAFTEFNKKIPGFINKNAILLAPETRTSAPVTIERDKVTLESNDFSGLYPCGEGAGFAGGITSAAVDGVKVANQLLEKEKNFC